MPLGVLSRYSDRPDTASIVLRAMPAPWQSQSELLVVRRRGVGRGVREEIELRSYADVPLAPVVSLAVAVDFADLFSVKAGHPRHVGERSVRVAEDRLVWTWKSGEVVRQAEIAFEGPGLTLDPVGALWRLQVPPRGSVRIAVDEVVSFGGPPLSEHGHRGLDVDHLATARSDRWLETTPVLHCDDDDVTDTVARSVIDLGALRLFDDQHPDRPVLAAGAPWFMTVFGRDALFASWMALPVDASLALGVLELLAARQGREVVPERDEEPGRILHELRFVESSTLSLSSGSPYYGSADATPLFVMLLAEAARWGAPREEIEPLLAAADAALDWCERYGDRDGDGWIEYERQTDSGLQNQGWKDSYDGVRFADGEVALPPIALCEVQAYHIAALRARADLADLTGHGDAALLRARADHLAAAFDETFWMPSRQCYAIGLDGHKRLIDSVTTNAGHALWSRVVPAGRVDSLASTLRSPALATGWGLRTLAATEGGYNPMSYHCGSVWPHDTAIVAAGLAASGHATDAEHLAAGLFAAAGHFDQRLPELFCGLDRRDVPVPVSYPTSCSPQAWAAASPLLLLRSLLGFDPDLPRGVLRVRPRLPEAWGTVRWRGIRLGTRRVHLTARGEKLLALDGLPEGVRVDVG